MGSEMCIRDRPNTATRLRGNQRQSSCCWRTCSQARCSSFHTPRPVQRSYISNRACCCQCYRRARQAWHCVRPYGVASFTGCKNQHPHRWCLRRPAISNGQVVQKLRTPIRLCKVTPYCRKRRQASIVQHQNALRQYCQSYRHAYRIRQPSLRMWSSRLYLRRGVSYGSRLMARRHPATVSSFQQS